MKKKAGTPRKRGASKPRGHADKMNKSRAKSFRWELLDFTRHIESLSRAADMTMRTMAEALKKETERFDHLMKEKGVRTVEKDGKESYRIKPEDLGTFKRHHKDMLSCCIALRDVPRIFFCSLVHQYDAYLGRLLRVAFFVKPELLNASQRQLAFTDLVALPSIDAAREYVIEKEVETVIRDSHVAQFEWMENRFGLPLRKELPIWPKFVELTERRNLFVHCDGVVSSQYISVCQKHGVSFDSAPSVGDELDVSPEYFQSAVECMMEIGIKLGHVLWRKLQPGDLEEADGALHDATFDFLCEERYALTKTLLLFAVGTLKKQASEHIRCINLVNLAIAQNFSGERDKALELLKGVDWSASEDKFKLAVAVLEHRYLDAVRVMKHIGSKGAVTRVDYSSWPLFKEFRHTSQFLSTYKDLFGQDFVLPKTDSPGQPAKTEEPTRKSTVRAGARP